MKDRYSREAAAKLEATARSIFADVWASNDEEHARYAASVEERKERESTARGNKTQAAPKRRGLTDYTDTEFDRLEEAVSDERSRRLNALGVDVYPQDEPDVTPEPIDTTGMTPAAQAAAELVQGAARLRQ